MKIKNYDEEVCRILNPYQAMLYISNGVKPLDEYVSVDSKERYIIVYVFSKSKTQELFRKFRNHELEMGMFVGV